DRIRSSMRNDHLAAAAAKAVQVDGLRPHQFPAGTWKFSGLAEYFRRIAIEIEIQLVAKAGCGRPRDVDRRRNEQPRQSRRTEHDIDRIHGSWNSQLPDAPFPGTDAEIPRPLCVERPVFRVVRTAQRT